MTREDLKSLWPVLEAFKDGKTIQYLSYGQWGDEDSLTFSQAAGRYRIKPEPKLRPWKPEEVPVGALVRPMTCIESRCLISGVDSSSIDIPWRNWDEKELRFSSLLVGWEHSTDNGKTWHPCGVEESQ